MCIRPFPIILAFCCLLAFSGCRALDAFVHDVNDTGTAARAAARDPESPLPAEARTMLELFGLAAWAGTTLYQKIRHGELTKTAKVIVQGVAKTPDALAKPVLESIKDEMLKAGDYKRRNALVDKLKES